MVVSLSLAKRRVVKEAFGECLSCGSTDNLELHHIDGNPRNNDSSNWLVLCRDCHVREHGISRSATLIRLAKLKRQAGVCCPDCGGVMVKAGFQQTNRRGDKRQMYVCTRCRRRTVNPRSTDA